MTWKEVIMTALEWVILFCMAALIGITLVGILCRL
jgi:TRAP-type C4-dicarboxylate transport system permease small subunit